MFRILERMGECRRTLAREEKDASASDLKLMYDQILGLAVQMAKPDFTNNGRAEIYLNEAKENAKLSPLLALWRYLSPILVCRGALRLPRKKE